MSTITIKKSPLFRFIAYTVLAAFAMMLPVQPSYAQVAIVMPPAGQMIHITRHYEPPQMLGLKINLKDPFSFDFIMDQGQSQMSAADQRAEFNKIIKYFLVSLAMPNKNMWVNLSPYESDRLIPEIFGQTEMGRDLLAQDYILKQFTASLMYPEDGLGKAFWSKVYAEAQARFGTTDINVNTFNKVWIVADKADIYQKGDTAFLVSSHLKVMLEQDFMAIEKNNEQFGNAQALQDVNKDAKAQMASNIVREIIIPAIEKEVNEGKNFAAVRQAYSAEIMATWFKKTLRASLLGQVFADKSKISGQQSQDPKAKEKIYQQYLKAYKKGVFNYVKEDPTPDGQTIPRKYFSGGLKEVDERMLNMNPDPAMVNSRLQGWISAAKRLMFVGVAFAAFATTASALPTAWHQSSPILFATPHFAQQTAQETAAKPVAAPQSKMHATAVKTNKDIKNAIKKAKITVESDGNLKPIATGKLEITLPNKYDKIWLVGAVGSVPGLAAGYITHLLVAQHVVAVDGYFFLKHSGQQVVMFEKDINDSKHLIIVVLPNTAADKVDPHQVITELKSQEQVVKAKPGAGFKIHLNRKAAKAQAEASSEKVKAAGKKAKTEVKAEVKTAEVKTKAAAVAARHGFSRFLDVFKRKPKNKTEEVQQNQAEQQALTEVKAEAEKSGVQLPETPAAPAAQQQGAPGVQLPVTPAAPEQQQVAAPEQKQAVPEQQPAAAPEQKQAVPEQQPAAAPEQKQVVPQQQVAPEQKQVAPGVQLPAAPATRIPAAPAVNPSADHPSAIIMERMVTHTTVKWTKIKTSKTKSQAPQTSAPVVNPSAAPVAAQPAAQASAPSIQKGNDLIKWLEVLLGLGAIVGVSIVIKNRLTKAKEDLSIKPGDPQAQEEALNAGKAAAEAVDQQSKDARQNVADKVKKALRNARQALQNNRDDKGYKMSLVPVNIINELLNKWVNSGNLNDADRKALFTQLGKIQVPNDIRNLIQQALDTMSGPVAPSETAAPGETVAPQTAAPAETPQAAAPEAQAPASVPEAVNPQPQKQSVKEVVKRIVYDLKNIRVELQTKAKLSPLAKPEKKTLTAVITVLEEMARWKAGVPEAENVEIVKLYLADIKQGRPEFNYNENDLVFSNVPETAAPVAATEPAVASAPVETEVQAVVVPEEDVIVDDGSVYMPTTPQAMGLAAALTTFNEDMRGSKGHWRLDEKAGIVLKALRAALTEALERVRQHQPEALQSEEEALVNAEIENEQADAELANLIRNHEEAKIDEATAKLAQTEKDLIDAMDTLANALLPVLEQEELAAEQAVEVTAPVASTPQEVVEQTAAEAVTEAPAVLEVPEVVQQPPAPVPAAVNASVDPKAAAARTRLVNMINNFEDAQQAAKAAKGLSSVKAKVTLFWARRAYTKALAAAGAIAVNLQPRIKELETELNEAKAVEVRVSKEFWNNSISYGMSRLTEAEEKLASAKKAFVGAILDALNQPEAVVAPAASTVAPATPAVQTQEERSNIAKAVADQLTGLLPNISAVDLMRINQLMHAWVEDPQSLSKGDRWKRSLRQRFIKWGVPYVYNTDNFSFEPSVVFPEAASVNDEIAKLDEQIKANPDQRVVLDQKRSVVYSYLDMLGHLNKLKQDIIDLANPSDANTAVPLGDYFDNTLKELARMEQNPAVKEIADAARNNVGGINLSDEHLTINIKVDGQGMPLPAQFQDRIMSNFNGLTSIIRRIVPVTQENVPALYTMAG